MSHISYNEFKNRFGDLGITKYVKAISTVKTNESGIDAVRINSNYGALASGKITSIIIHYNG